MKLGSHYKEWREERVKDRYGIKWYISYGRIHYSSGVSAGYIALQKDNKTNIYIYDQPHGACGAFEELLANILWKNQVEMPDNPAPDKVIRI